MVPLAELLPQTISPYLILMLVGFVLGAAGHLYKSKLVVGIGIAMIFLATELPGLQSALLTQSLTGLQWFACLGLAAILPVVVEGGKWFRRRQPRTAS